MGITTAENTSPNTIAENIKVINTQPTLITQIVSGSVGVAEERGTAGLSLTFSNLPEISGISSLSISTDRKCGAIGASIGGNVLSFSIYNSSGLARDFSATETAFYIKE